MSQARPSPQRKPRRPPPVDDDVDERQEEELLRFHWSHQGPNWRSRRRRQTSWEACATDVAQRLATAAEALSVLLQAHFDVASPGADTAGNHNLGLTLPATAVAWILAWAELAVAPHKPTPAESSSASDGAPMERVLSLWSHQRKHCRQWQGLAQKLAGVAQLRMVADPWPPPSIPRQRDYEPPWEPSATTRPRSRKSPLSAQAWLEAYQAWQVRPVLDFSRPQAWKFVWLDRVPPECIRAWPQDSSALKVLRVEKSGMSSLAQLWGSVVPPAETSDAPESEPVDPLAAPGRWERSLPLSSPLPPILASLTHLKLVSCGLERLVGPEGEPLLSQHCPALVRLCLAHNALTDAALSEAGLDALEHLQSVDLSYNFLEGHWRGQGSNWSVLNLAHNRIDRIGRGLSKLYGLQVLNLEDNRLVLAKVARLARLPVLRDVRLQNNPLAQGSTSRRRRRRSVSSHDSYRHVLWELFREARNGVSDEEIPVIDGQTAATESMVRTSRRLGSANAMIASPEHLRRPIPVPILRQCPRRRLTEIPGQGDNGDYATNDSVLSIPTEAVVPGQSLEVVVHPSSEEFPDADFTAWQVWESLFVTEEEEDAVGEELQVEEDEGDVTMSEEKEEEEEVERKEAEEAEADKDSGDPARDEKPVDDVPASKQKTTTSIDELEVAALVNVESSLVVADPAIVTKDMEADDGTADSIADIHQADRAGGNDVSGGAPSDEQGSTGGPQSSLEHEASENPSKKAVSTPQRDRKPLDNMSEHEQWQVSPIGTEASVQGARLEVLQPEASPAESRSTGSNPLLTPKREVEPSPSSLGASPQQSSFRVGAFPDYLWQDENSSLAPSSIVQSVPGGISESDEQKVYELAEAKSTFVGQHTYKSLTIREHLELYFRLFVFSQALPSRSEALDLSIEEDWQSILELYPRIQLWPIDRRLRGVTSPDQLGSSQETFRRVWTENVVACGKPSLRRLTPNLTARLGFHGELIWSTNAVHLRQEAVSMYRQVIVCMSSAALYVILDHDAVAEKAKDQKRRFPLSLPLDACFAEAKWPHALARHPFAMLRKVIIGFGFQRLTLRFSNSSFPSPEDFTYVLLTCNRLSTVSLLKEIQEITGEAKNAAGLDPLEIENDDPQVLDALGLAVTPDTIGIVFHYGILQQRWKKGDRPNVRRVLLVTDTNLYLLDEDYLGDGAVKDTTNVAPDDLGLPRYRMVDSAFLAQVGQLHTGTDPTMITLVIRPLSRLARTRNWRLVCRDREGAERLVEDVRKAIGNSG